MMKLLAGRACRLLNMASLASDVGVDRHTIRAWLLVLEASFLVFRLPPYWVVVEVLKARLNRGLLPDLYFYRDSNGNEIDLLLPDVRTLHVAEIKSASTFSWSLIDGLRRFQALTRRCGKALLIYNGAEQYLSGEIQAIGFRNADGLLPEDEDPE